MRHKSIKSKTIITLMVAFLLLFTLAACDTEAGAPAEDPETAEEAAEVTLDKGPCLVYSPVTLIQSPQ